MWQSLARDGWEDLISLATPSFLKLLPARDVERALLTLVKNRRDHERLEAARFARGDALARAELPIVLDARKWRAARETEFMGALSGLQLPPREVGARVLRLYFHQLYDPHPTLLDVRSAVFAQKDGELRWSGGSLFIEWDAAFLAGVRELYLGYYRKDRPRFRRALAPLGLVSVEHELWRRFEGSDPENQGFALGEFRRTFVGLLARCRETGAHLHPDFVPLGIYLTCLYEHLGACGGAHDILAAFNDVQQVVELRTAESLAAQSAAL
jgi:hypothetical protein